LVDIFFLFLSIYGSAAAREVSCTFTYIDKKEKKKTLFDEVGSEAARELAEEHACAVRIWDILGHIRDILGTY